MLNFLYYRIFETTAAIQTSLRHAAPKKPAAERVTPCAFPENTPFAGPGILTEREAFTRMKSIE